MQGATRQRPIAGRSKMRSEGCWPADGVIAAVSPYREFGTPRWQLKDEDIPAKGSEQKVSDSTARMSALGQKQTYAAQNGMSALPSKADMRGAIWDVRFEARIGH